MEKPVASRFTLFASEQGWLWGILILFILIGFIYASVTPIFEASDELWHYPFVRHLADGNPLPVQDPANPGPWKQEASQQPLYYALAAALTFWIDTGDMEAVRWLNPHVDNGVLTPDGNTNLAIHRPEAERFPWQGTVLAVRLIRLVSVLMGAGTVFFTWRIARVVFPDRPALALAASAVNAFTPMFLFISGAVNNDNLAMLLCSAGLWLMLRNSQRQPALRDSLTLGLVLGLAALTKTSALGLVPLAGLSLLIATRDRFAGREWRGWLADLVRHGLAIVLPVMVIAGWWYLRNYRLYGDWLGWNAFIQVLGQRSHPASLRQLWSERWGFALSYWGLFGGVNVPMPDWVYHTLNAAGALSAAGLIIFVTQSVRHALRRPEAWLTRLWPLGLLLAWTALVFIGLVRWATVTWSSQGRLVFPAISAISVLLTAGLFGRGGVPRRAGRWLSAALVGFMLAISAIAPLAWIAPAYRPPAGPTDAEIAAIRQPLDASFGALRLLGYTLSSETVSPGSTIELTLYWETLEQTERNWSVFVHLNDPLINAPVAQRDMYPGQGLLATSLLRPGQRVANRYVILVPGAAYAPAPIDLVVGLYDYDTWERLPTADGREAILLQTIELIPASDGAYPNPVDFNFGDQLALVGYQMEPRRLRPGETITLTLYWQALQEMEVDYTVFTHLRDLEDPSNRIFAQHDAAAPGGTSTWQVGQVVKAAYHLTLDGDTPAGVLEIEVGVYHQNAAGKYPRLQIITPDGRPVDDFLILGKVRVD